MLTRETARVTWNQVSTSSSGQASFHGCRQGPCELCDSAAAGMQHAGGKGDTWDICGASYYRSPRRQGRQLRNGGVAKRHVASRALPFLLLYWVPLWVMSILHTRRCRARWNGTGDAGQEGRVGWVLGAAPRRPTPADDLVCLSLPATDLMTGGLSGS